MHMVQQNFMQSTTSWTPDTNEYYKRSPWQRFVPTSWNYHGDTGNNSRRSPGATFTILTGVSSTAATRSQEKGNPGGLLKHSRQTATYLSAPPMHSTSVSAEIRLENDASALQSIQTALSLTTFSHSGMMSSTLPNGLRRKSPSNAATITILPVGGKEREHQISKWSKINKFR